EQKKEICLKKQSVLVPSNKDLANYYSVGKLTIHDILKNKKKWFLDESIKSKKEPKWPLLEETLWLWVQGALGTEMDLNDKILQKKAIQFVNTLNYKEFKGSSSWEIIINSNFKQEDIFNVDETGLFWRLEPSKSLATHTIKGHKKSKDRVTILLDGNSAETEKIILVFIGKSKNPRPFRKIKRADLNKINIQYEYNKTAWMQ
ncbi:31570_t:CDS:2, partial [Gigaspora margarita]